VVRENQSEPRSGGVDAGIELEFNVNVGSSNQSVRGWVCFEEDGVGKSQIGDCERHSEGDKNSIRHAEF
jgi:hypothetical protein